MAGGTRSAKVWRNHDEATATSAGCEELSLSAISAKVGYDTLAECGPTHVPARISVYAILTHYGGNGGGRCVEVLEGASDVL